MDNQYAGMMARYLSNRKDILSAPAKTSMNSGYGKLYNVSKKVRANRRKKVFPSPKYPLVALITILK